MKAWMGGRKRKLDMERKSEVAQQRQFFAQKRKERQRAANKGDAGASGLPPPAPTRVEMGMFGNGQVTKRATDRSKGSALGKDVAGLKANQDGVIQMHPVGGELGVQRGKERGGGVDRRVRGDARVGTNDVKRERERGRGEGRGKYEQRDEERGKERRKATRLGDAVQGKSVAGEKVGEKRGEVSDGNDAESSGGDLRILQDAQEKMTESFFSQEVNARPNSFHDHSFLSNAVNKRVPPGASADHLVEAEDKARADAQAVADRQAHARARSKAQARADASANARAQTEKQAKAKDDAEANARKDRIIPSKNVQIASPRRAAVKTSFVDHAFLGMESLEDFGSDIMATPFSKTGGKKGYSSRAKGKMTTPSSASRDRSTLSSPFVSEHTPSYFHSAAEPLSKTADGSFSGEVSTKSPKTEEETEPSRPRLRLASIEADGFNAGVQDLERSFLGQPDDSVGLFGRRKRSRLSARVEKEEEPATEELATEAVDELREGVNKTEAKQSMEETLSPEFRLKASKSNFENGGETSNVLKKTMDHESSVTVNLLAPQKINWRDPAPMKSVRRLGERNEITGLSFGHVSSPFAEARAPIPGGQKEVEKKDIVKGASVDIPPASSILPSVSELLNT